MKTPEKLYRIESNTDIRELNYIGGTNVTKIGIYADSATGNPFRVYLPDLSDQYYVTRREAALAAVAKLKKDLFILNRMYDVDINNDDELVVLSLMANQLTEIQRDIQNKNAEEIDKYFNDIRLKLNEKVSELLTK